MIGSRVFIDDLNQYSKNKNTINTPPIPYDARRMSGKVCAIFLSITSNKMKCVVSMSPRPLPSGNLSKNEERVLMEIVTLREELIKSPVNVSLAFWVNRDIKFPPKNEFSLAKMILLPMAHISTPKAQVIDFILVESFKNPINAMGRVSARRAPLEWLA